jgi:cyclophilin family peptidyl-prolyl cis-trans isomerase
MTPKSFFPVLKLRTAALAFSIAGLLTACGGSSSPSSPANQTPVAAAKLSGEAVLNATTTFDTTGTNDPDGTIASRSWAYGDGQTGTADSHVYSTTGTYTATYTVTDDAGASAAASVPVAVVKCSAAGTKAAQLSPYTSVCMQTTRGEVVLEVFPALAPITVANFLKYVDDGFYANTIFHRVIAGFVVQGGGFQPGLVAKPASYAPIVLESNTTLQNWQYTVAMARTSVANSATSQFFINLVDNHALDYNAGTASPNGYAVFGQVISGTTVIDGMGAVATGSVGAFTDVPVQDIVIRSVVRLP